MSDTGAPEVGSRRAARERALELLYEAEVKGVGIEELLASLPVAPADLAVELVRGVEAHRERIDEILARRVAPRWSLARLAAVDRAVMRLATYELAERPDRSQAVIINEAVVLARKYGSDDSPRFVNGVLAAVAAEVRGGTEGAASSGGRAPAGGGGGGAEPVEGLIIDLDGVIRHWDDRSLPSADRELGLPEGTIAHEAFEPQRLAAAMRGDITFEGWCAGLGEAVAARHPVDPEAVAAAFANSRWTIDDDVLEFVQEARTRVPVALLSNASTRLVEDLRSSGIDDRFDAIVGSADIGVCKPDVSAFRTVAARLGVAPERCLVIDDLPDNVAGARAAGMRAELFTGVESLRDALAAAGLLARS